MHIAKLNAPRANGSGALPSQQTGSQPGAVNRRAEPDLREIQIRQNRRTGDDSPIKRPREVPGAAADVDRAPAAAQHRARHGPDDGVGDEKVGSEKR